MESPRFRAAPEYGFTRPAADPVGLDDRHGPSAADQRDVVRLAVGHPEPIAIPRGARRTAEHEGAAVEACVRSLARAVQPWVDPRLVVDDRSVAADLRGPLAVGVVLDAFVGAHQPARSVRGEVRGVARVNAGASKAGIALKGASPEGENAVRVQLEDQPFAAVVGWLDTMAREYGGQIKSINSTPGNATGTVSVRATLQGGI